MKQLFKTVLLSSTFAAATFHASATIWRLNNSNGGTLTPTINASFAMATTLQQAHDNASVLSGDTIHVEQSTTSYGSLAMTKKLTIIGAGYFLGMNPKTQVNKAYGSPVDNITMTASTCAGSTITGLSITGTVRMGTSRLLVTRNYIYAGNYANTITVGSGNATSIDSVVIAGNYIDGGSYNYGIGNVSGTTGNVTNFIFSNNYSYGNVYASMVLGGTTSGILKNNVFEGSAISVYNMYVVNNIAVGTATNTFNNSVIEYNLGKNGNQFSTPAGLNNTIGAGNIFNTSQGFAGGTTSTDGAWTLLGTSPAKASGKSGDDMGMFGSSLPYVLSGIPTVPNIYALTIGTVAAGATSISVTVSTKSN